MINYIYELSKEHNCSIGLMVGPDGVMTITVYGKKCSDFIIIKADWDEKLIKDCINDTIRRTCYD